MLNEYNFFKIKRIETCVKNYIENYKYSIVLQFTIFLFNLNNAIMIIFYNKVIKYI